VIALRGKKRTNVKVGRSCTAERRNPVAQMKQAEAGGIQKGTGFPPRGIRAEQESAEMARKIMLYAVC
jgi:hypothetical protein